MNKIVTFVLVSCGMVVTCLPVYAENMQSEVQNINSQIDAAVSNINQNINTRNQQVQQYIAPLKKGPSATTGGNQLSPIYRYKQQAKTPKPQEPTSSQGSDITGFQPQSDGQQGGDNAGKGWNYGF